MHDTETGNTVIAALPGHTVVAHGSPILDLGNSTQYEVRDVKLVPGQQLNIGATYRIIGGAHPHGLFVKLDLWPYPRHDTAVFSVDE